MTHCPASLSHLLSPPIVDIMCIDREFILWALGFIQPPSRSVAPLLAKPLIHGSLWEHSTFQLQHLPFTYDFNMLRWRISKGRSANNSRTVSDKLHAILRRVNERRGSFGMDGGKEAGAEGWGMTLSLPGESEVSVFQVEGIGSAKSSSLKWSWSVLRNIKVSAARVSPLERV